MFALFFPKAHRELTTNQMVLKLLAVARICKILIRQNAMVLRQNYMEMSNHDSSCTQAKIYHNSSCGVGSNPFIFLFSEK